MKIMTQETKTKLHDTHVKLAQTPERLAFLRKIAQDPVNKEKRALAMKKKWQEPEFKAKMKAAAAARAEAKAKAKAEAAPVDEAAVERTEARITEGLTKTAETLGKAPLTEAETADAVVEAAAPIAAEKAEAIAEVTDIVMGKKKKKPTDEQKAKYAANRKAKRAAAKS